MSCLMYIANKPTKESEHCESGVGQQGPSGGAGRPDALSPGHWRRPGVILMYNINTRNIP